MLQESTERGKKERGWRRGLTGQFMKMKGVVGVVESERERGVLFTL